MGSLQEGDKQEKHTKARSEERRVGKECRSRCYRYHSHKKVRGSEPVGMDEALVPHDVIMETFGGRKVVRNQIIDDEIADLLKKIPDRKVTVFFFKQKTAYEIGLGIPAEPLFRSE